MISNLQNFGVLVSDNNSMVIFLLNQNPFLEGNIYKLNINIFLIINHKKIHPMNFGIFIQYVIHSNS